MSVYRNYIKYMYLFSSMHRWVLKKKSIKFKCRTEWRISNRNRKERCKFNQNTTVAHVFIPIYFYYYFFFTLQMSVCDEPRNEKCTTVATKIVRHRSLSESIRHRISDLRIPLAFTQQHPITLYDIWHNLQFLYYMYVYVAKVYWSYPFAWTLFGNGGRRNTRPIIDDRLWILYRFHRWR